MNKTSILAFNELKLKYELKLKLLLNVYICNRHLDLTNNVYSYILLIFLLKEIIISDILLN